MTAIHALMIYQRIRQAASGLDIRSSLAATDRRSGVRRVTEMASVVLLGCGLNVVNGGGHPGGVAVY